MVGRIDEAEWYRADVADFSIVYQVTNERNAV